MLVALLVAASMAALPVASAQFGTEYDCRKADVNTQCNAFGSIEMDAQRNMQGSSEVIDITTTIDDTYETAGARWIMFSIRHDSAGTASPISLTLKEFRSPHGEIFTSRIDHDVPNEINVWVHVVDIPEGEPITMKVQVDSSDKGAYRVESLVMPFDRGYEPLRSGNEDISLFSYTLLGVNGASGSGGAGGKLGGNLRTPGPALLPALAALGAAAYVVSRRVKA